MSKDFDPSITAVEDRASHPTIPTFPTGVERTATVTKIRYLEREVFEGGGHIRRGVTPARAVEIAALINDLRRVLGWLEIGLDGQWRWPASAGTAVVERQRVAESAGRKLDARNSLRWTADREAYTANAAVGDSRVS